MNPRNLNMRLGLAAALMGSIPATAQEPTPEADKEADEALAREMEARRRREQEQRQAVETLVLERTRETPAELNIHYQPEPRRRSKRAQRVKERGWR